MLQVVDDEYVTKSPVLSQKEPRPFAEGGFFIIESLPSDP